MLKALELVGFKSFADKTRLEFTRGITAIVGPNGSGKSNVVDAIKWVLGEQSVKSLRGREMADVIFNGSASRPPMNAAETTLTFDNASRLLPLDTPEVQITRRVYRNGEGEYLINRQPCRLRDIRDLFSGTGVATEAYSVIEQGKVDVLLQSSPRDRRAIFEEAAGISRFKAKKVEALRRLERVDQNLLRLSDIVAEVEHRLRTVRVQAAKARRYREHVDRLQELRTQVALADWRRLSTRIAEAERELADVAELRAGAAAAAECLETRVFEMEVTQTASSEQARTLEVDATAARERVGALESEIELQRARLRELDEETARLRRGIATLGQRAQGLEEQARQTTADLEGELAQQLRLQASVTAGEADLTRIAEQLVAERAELDRLRGEQLDARSASAVLASELNALENRRAGAATIVERCGERATELASAQAKTTNDVALHAAEVERFAVDVAARREELDDAQAALAARRQQAAVCSTELHELQRQHAGLAERAAVLEELERSFEGLGMGVRDVLHQARAGEPALAALRGVIADLIQARIEFAPLVDVALGDAAQHLVARADQPLLAYLAERAAQLPGRVHVERLAAEVGITAGIDLSAEPNVLGRALAFVEVSDVDRPLIERMLGETWIVADLTTALRLSTGLGRGQAFVTRAGEWVGPHGTVSLGPRHVGSGLVSRRSELRALQSRLAELAEAMQRLSAEATSVDGQISAAEQAVQALVGAEQRTALELQDARLALSAANERQGQLADQARRVEQERRAAGEEVAATSAQLAVAQTQQAALATNVQALSEAVSLALRAFDELDAKRDDLGRAILADRVELAKSEERLAALRARQAQFAQDHSERRRLLDETRAQIDAAIARAEQTQTSILRSESQLAELYLRKESLAAAAQQFAQQRLAEQQARATLAGEAQAARAQLRRLGERQHSVELGAGEVRHERQALGERFREDYGVDLASLLEAPSQEGELERAATELEIAELRRKLQNIGNVNLEALAELEELEPRHANLSAQYADLAQAKRSLEQIIHRINADSRRLFAATLETVRGHFQTLFRKLFGGGQADIVLDEGVDLLDSGIEIVARPPGKEPRGISLLSGGEKTLTCVALLLAIFQYRPSPFCVLDEVDAALDEANIERFAAVLQEFLGWTQFVVVTHSKKTMTCASTLYGVTMQESGVSKQVSVRFEDVTGTEERGATPGAKAAARPAVDGPASVEGAEPVLPPASDDDAGTQAA